MKIEANKVYTFKLNNADEIVAKVVEIDDEGDIVVSNPLSAIPSEKGIQLVFAVFTADPKENFTINKTAITSVGTTREEVSDHYLEITTGLKPVRKPSIILG